MTTLGKIAPAGFQELIAPHLGVERPEVLIGPRPGGDAAIVRLGAGRVMAVTMDPLSLVPGLGPAVSGRLAVHLLASDLWTTGIPPAYATVCLSLPPALPEADLAAFVAAMGAEWTRLGVAVVGGHTGRYVGCDLTIVGAATLIGVGDEGRYVGPDFVKPGDRVIVTRDCAVEATAIAAIAFPRRLAQKLDADGMERARARIDQVSVVDHCRAAIRVGVRDRGVSAMHDATEGGVIGALVELARSTGHDMRVEKALIPVSAEAEAACEMFGVDPYVTLSEGTLVLAVRPGHAAAVMSSLAGDGIAAAEVGEIVKGNGTVWLGDADGQVERLSEPPADPYWAAYARAVEEGWD